jgi:hypothetical protein
MPKDESFSARSDRAETAQSTVEILCGSRLCRLQIWDEAEWLALPESKRPIKTVHVPGLGWLGAVPVVQLN